jgi:hypothetical protein
VRADVLLLGKRLNEPMVQHPHFDGHIVELFADIGADLGQHTTAAALPISEGEFMADLDIRTSHLSRNWS